MLFSITFNLALAIFTLGTIYRVVRWFTVKVGPDAGQFTVRTRISRAFTGLFAVLFSRHIFRLIWVFLFQVIFQGHILKKDPWRWLMHFYIFAGILLLVLFHALDDQISASLFSNYSPTVNPYLFLRNLFAATGVAGDSDCRLSPPDIQWIKKNLNLPRRAGAGPAVDYFIFRIFS